MPCLNLSTNVSLEGVDTSSILKEATSTVAELIGKPPNLQYGRLLSKIQSAMSYRLNYGLDMEYVMIVLKGSVPIAFGGTEDPAAYGELVSIGGLSPNVNKQLSAGIAAILESKLSVPKSRFFLKFYDTKGSNFGWNGSTF